jgi:Domain of unknown function (DUF4349)
MRAIRSLLPLLVIALFLVACSGSASAPNLGPVGGQVTDEGSGTGSGSTPGAIPAASAAAGNPQPVQGGNNGPIAAVDDAKIIRTGSMGLEVSDLAAATRTARDGIVALGGYVGASTTTNGADRPSAEITYRIPASKWEQGLDLMRGLNGLTTKVVTEHTEAVEVTSQVIDLEARIANLRASEVALQGIAEKATKVSDVLEVQAQLTDTRGQIEQLDGQLKDLNDRAAYSALTVQFNVPVVAVDVAAKGWEPSTVVDEAAATMVSLLQGLATAAIWFGIVWLPVLLVLGIATLIVVWIARRLGVGRRTPDAAAPPPSAGVMPPPAAPLAGEG